jgi:carboxylesterase
MMLGGAPFGTLEASGRAPAVLGLHGFGATTQEVGMVVDVARELGLRGLAPLLPGHGSSVLDLARMRYADWRAAAERALLGLARDAGMVIVVGSSMGSLIALDLAADFPDIVLGVGVLGSPIRLRWPYPSLALAAISKLGIPDFTTRKSGPDIRDPEGRRTQVTCPAFIAHGRHDHVCPVRNARLVYAKLGTRPWEKELLILEQSYHIITRDLERDVLRARLARFIERLAASQSPPEAVASDAGRPVTARRAVGL